jgi:hypothetical protein
MTVSASWLMGIDKAICMVEVFPMATERLVLPGIVKNGLVVSQSETSSPDGARVDIMLGPADMPLELQAELAQWQKVSDEAWAMIDE